MASSSSCPFKNLNCYGVINLENMGLRHMEMILATILYKQLHNSIGRKSSNDEGKFDFVIRGMNVDFIFPKTLPGMQISATTRNKSSPTISKKSQKTQQSSRSSHDSYPF
jgi:hypothetical protein